MVMTGSRKKQKSQRRTLNSLPSWALFPDYGKTGPSFMVRLIFSIGLILMGNCSKNFITPDEGVMNVVGLKAGFSGRLMRVSS